MTNTICLDENYSTTRLLCKIVNDECLRLNEDGRIKEECKWNINNLEFNIQNSKLIGTPEDKFETVLFLPEGEERKGEGGLRTKGYFKQSLEDKPLISIITVVFNGEKYLEETIQSVINQSYDNVEYIIIDGGSTDGTLDIIKKYEDKISYWVSEKDEGIYDAMNKGLKVVTGKYISILNADDYYEKDALFLSVKMIEKEKSDYCIANVKFVGSKSITRPIYPLIQDKVYQEMPYPHVSAVIASYIYKQVGLFDTEFKIAGDQDMAVRIHLAGYKASYLNKLVAHLEKGGISSGIDANKECLKVAIKHGKSKPKAYIVYIKQLVNLFLARNLPVPLVRFLQKVKKSRFR